MGLLSIPLPKQPFNSANGGPAFGTLPEAGPLTTRKSALLSAIRRSVIHIRTYTQCKGNNRTKGALLALFVVHFKQLRNTLFKIFAD